MALISLRELTNHPNAASFDKAASSTNLWFAEDYLAIRDAIQLGVTGIRTNTLQVGDATTPAASGGGRFGGLVEVGTGLAAGDTCFTAVGNSTVGNNLTVGGGISVSNHIAVGGLVDGVDLSAHSHTGSDGTVTLPLTSITGASGAWSAHDHSGDGSSAVDSDGIAANVVTFGKMATAAMGLTSGTIARGDYLAATRTVLDYIADPGSAVLPLASEWISPWGMAAEPGSPDTEAVLTNFPSGSPDVDVFGRLFAPNSNNTIRFTFPFSSLASSASLTFISIVDLALDGDTSPGDQVTFDVTLSRIGDDGEASLSTTEVVLGDPSVAANIPFYTTVSIGAHVTSSTDEIVNVLVERTDVSPAESPPANLYLIGAFARFEISTLYTAP